MAFNFTYLQRVEVTADPNKISNPAQGQVTGGPTIWIYNAASNGANQSAAAVSAADYFLPASGYMNVGDLIYTVTNDPAAHFLSVATVTAGTTITTTTVV